MGEPNLRTDKIRYDCCVWVSPHVRYHRRKRSSPRFCFPSHDVTCSRPMSPRATAAVLFVAVNLGVLLVAGAVLTESAWDGLTYGNTWDGKDTSVGPDEYEACERVRRSGVRARSNAYSSASYLGAPTFQVASNGYLWGARSSRGLRGAAALFGLVSAALGVALAHASFLYHASITVEFNRVDVCAALHSLACRAAHTSPL